MNLQQFLLILRARYKIALLVLIVTVSATFAVSELLPRQYTATAAVVVDVRAPDPIAGVTLPPFGYMATQIDIIKSDRVALKAVKSLRLEENATVKAEWLEATEGRGKLDVWVANLLQKKLAVRPSRESNFVSIDYTGIDPGFAAAVANAFAQAYIETNIELKVEPARQYARWFESQGTTLRENLEKAQSRLSAAQQKHGIVASDERLDVETAKLNEMSTQLTIVVGQTTDAQSKQKSGAAADTLPEVVQNPLIQNLKADIARGEAKLQEVAGNLGKNHPQYKRMESELASLRQKLEAETRHITSGFATSRSVGKDRESELRAAIEAQRRKLLDLKRVRDELAVLTRDVEAAQKTYDTVSQRFNQQRLESQATQTNVAVLTPAEAPIEPSFPKPLRNTLLSIVLGTLLGIGAAIMLEMLDRRIRSAEDLAEMLPLPMLGVIGNGKRPSRLALRPSSMAPVVR